ncbi:MAG: hypothetical protein KKH94_01060 [Candidatus Omnitrophica bacterium]|nr:hypothetical protein [Candidatus Omnitrophota bacterium]
MNLLIPDSQGPQSYYVILGMKSVCRKIIVTVPHVGKFSRIYSSSSNSKYVTKNYSVTGINDAWFKNGCTEKATALEENFLAEILHICKREKITVIYPSSDAMVSFFSKHNHHFSERSITIPVPHYSIVRSTMNKYTITTMAAQAGIDIPQTFLLADESSLEKALSHLRFPVLVKPCFGTVAQNIYKINNKEKLYSRFNALKLKTDNLMVQEFIPGNKFISDHVLTANNYNLALSYKLQSEEPALKIWQNNGSDHNHLSIAHVDPNVFMLLKKLHYKGFANVQFKIDERDHREKLIDFNPRINLMAWIMMSYGINVPYVNYQIFQDQRITVKSIRYKGAMNTLQPIRDLSIFLVYLWCVVMKICHRYIFPAKKNPFKNIPSFMHIIMFHKKRYFSKFKRIDPLSTCVFTDPCVALCYSLFYFWHTCSKYPDDFQA